jgi:hypothetical protein
MDGFKFFENTLNAPRAALVGAIPVSNSTLEKMLDPFCESPVIGNTTNKEISSNFWILPN